MKRTWEKSVTMPQAEALYKLGFRERGVCWAWFCIQGLPEMIDIPTVDEAIDWLRKNHDIIICNKADPYVCPKTGKIQFGYTIKKCYPKVGWNARRYIGVSIWSSNIYAAKRDAIRKAISWIKKEKKDAERRRASKTRKRGIRS